MTDYAYFSVHEEGDYTASLRDDLVRRWWFATVGDFRRFENVRL